MIQSYVPAISHYAVYELDLARLKSQCAIALIQCLQIGIWELRDHLIEEVVFVDGNYAEPPSRCAHILRIGIHSNSVLRQFAHQRSEVMDECSVYVIGQDHEIRAFGLYQFRKLGNHLMA